MPTRVLEQLWSQCAPNGVIYPPTPVVPDRVAPIAVGAAVEVSSAMGQVRSICQWSTAKRVNFLMQIMGRDVATTVDRAAVSAV